MAFPKRRERKSDLFTTLQLGRNPLRTSCQNANSKDAQKPMDSIKIRHVPIWCPGGITKPIAIDSAPALYARSPGMSYSETVLMMGLSRVPVVSQIAPRELLNSLSERGIKP